MKACDSHEALTEPVSRQHRPTLTSTGLARVGLQNGTLAPQVDVITYFAGDLWRLSCQLSSLVLWPPGSLCRVAVACGPKDFRAHSMVDWFSRREDWPETVGLVCWVLPQEMLNSPAIFRNASCVATLGEAVWLTSPSYSFGEGCLDSIALSSPLPDTVCHPDRVFRTKPSENHAENFQRGLVPLGDFKKTPFFNGFALDGLQIVLGRAARSMGYLPDTEFQKPSRDWRSDSGAVEYVRAVSCGVSQGLSIPNVLEI